MFKLNNWIKRAVVVGLVTGGALFASAFPAGAATAPTLGAAANFAVLAGTTVTVTGPTTIGGNLGVSPGTAVTGEANITYAKSGMRSSLADAALGQSDLTTAYNAAAAETCSGAPDTQSLAGPQTILPGVYCYAAAAPTLSGTVTLSGNGVFIFKIGSTLITGTGATVALTNGAQACNVFWQVGSSATLGTNTTFVGNILALTSITLNNGATIIDGRALARNGAVTMDTNTVHKPKTCTPLVGGIVADDSDTGALALQTDSSSGSNAWLWTGGLAVAAASLFVLLGGGAWYVRRRRVQ